MTVEELMELLKNRRKQAHRAGNEADDKAESCEDSGDNEGANYWWGVSYDEMQKEKKLNITIDTINEMVS